MDTGLIARHPDQLTVSPKPSEDAWAVAVATLLGPPNGNGFSLWAPLTRHVLLDGRAFRVTISDDVFTVVAEGWQRQVSRDRGGWVVDGKRTELRSVLVAGAVVVFGPERNLLEVVNDYMEFMVEERKKPDVLIL